MKYKVVTGIMLLLLLMRMLTLAFNIQPVKSNPTTWAVDDDGPADFSSIQEAINSPEVKDGDTIFVRAGTFYENVVVNKTHACMLTKYEIVNNKLIRKNPFCPRCGAGTFMTDHGEFYSCGKCGDKYSKDTFKKRKIIV